MFFDQLAFAMSQTGVGGSGEQGNPLIAFMPLIILFVIFYFLLIRPQQKKAKEHREMLSNLKKGDSVITGGGLYGRIKNVSEDMLTLDLGNNMEVKVNRNYISQVTENTIVDSDKEDKKAKS